MKIGPNNFLGVNWEPMSEDGSTKYQLWYGSEQNASSRTVYDLDQQLNKYIYEGRKSGDYKGPLAQLRQMAAIKRKHDQRKALSDLNLQLTQGLPSFNPHVRELGNSILQKFPESQGWHLETQKTVTDFTRYASIIPVVAVNDRTNERHIIDIDSAGTQKTLFTRAKLSAQRRMLEMTEPGKHVTGTWSASINPQKGTSSFIKMTPIDDSGLNKALYRMPFSGGFRDLNKEERQQMSKLNMDILQKFPLHKGPYARSFAYVDTETGFGREVLSVGALNIALDKDGKILGRLDDGFFRFYPSRNEKTAGFRTAAAVNGLSNELINGYRKQQNARYGKAWSKKELTDLNKYLEGKVAFGHNIDSFDREVLRAGEKHLEAKGWFDTYTFMQNNGLSLDNKRDLEAWYKLTTGYTMSQGGWEHHQVQFDVGAGIESTAKLLADKGKLGRQARAIVDSDKGWSLASTDNVLNSSIIDTKTGEYIDMRNMNDNDTYSASIGSLTRGANSRYWFDADGTIFDTYDKSQQYNINGEMKGAYAAFDAGSTEPFIRTAKQINREAVERIIAAKLSGNFGGILTTALSATLRDGSTVPGHTDASLLSATRKAKREQLRQLNRAIVKYAGENYPNLNDFSKVRVSTNEWHVLKAGTDKFKYAKRYQGAKAGDVLIDDSSREGASWEKGSGAGTWTQISFGAGANAAYGGKVHASTPAPVPLDLNDLMSAPVGVNVPNNAPEITSIDDNGIPQIADGFAIEDLQSQINQQNQQSDISLIKESFDEAFNSTIGQLKDNISGIRDVYKAFTNAQVVANRARTFDAISKTIGSDDDLARKLLALDFKYPEDHPYIDDLMKHREVMKQAKTSRDSASLKTGSLKRLRGLSQAIELSEGLSEEQRAGLSWQADRITKAVKKGGLTGEEAESLVSDLSLSYRKDIQATKGKRREEAERNALEKKAEGVWEDIERSSLSQRKKAELNALYNAAKGSSTFEKSLKNLDEEFKNAEKSAAQLREGIRGLTDASLSKKFYNGELLAHTAQSNLSRWENASKGFVPRLLQRPLHFLNAAAKDGLQNWWDENYYLKYVGGNKAIEITGAMTNSKIPGVAQFGILANGGIRIAATGSQIAGTIAQNRMQVFGNQISQALNLLSAGVQTALIPLKLFGMLLGIGAISFKKFMNALNNFGTPLTGLSGVNYPSYEGHGSMDRLVGLKQGSLNGLTESFAEQSASLFTMGQFDTSRLIASALLGIFDTTYNPDMSGEEMLRANANSLVRQFNEADEGTRRNLVTWMKKVDPSGSLAQTVQVMSDMRIFDYDEYKDPGKKGVYWRPISDEERINIRRANYGWQNSLRQLDFTKARIGMNIWNAFGKDTMYGVNMALDNFSMGNYAKGIDGLIDTFKNVWNRMSEIISKSKLPEQLGDILKSIGNGLIEWLGSIDWSPLSVKIGGLMDIIVDDFAKLMQILGSVKIDIPKLLTGGDWLSFGSGAIDALKHQSIYAKYNRIELDRNDFAPGPTGDMQYRAALAEADKLVRSSTYATDDERFRQLDEIGKKYGVGKGHLHYNLFGDGEYINSATGWVTNPELIVRKSRELGENANGQQLAVMEKGYDYTVDKSIYGHIIKSHDSAKELIPQVASGMMNTAKEAYMNRPIKTENYVTLRVSDADSGTEKEVAKWYNGLPMGITQSEMNFSNKQWLFDASNSGGN